MQSFKAPHLWFPKNKGRADLKFIPSYTNICTVLSLRSEKSFLCCYFCCSLVFQIFAVVAGVPCFVSFPLTFCSLFLFTFSLTHLLTFSLTILFYFSYIQCNFFNFSAPSVFIIQSCLLTSDL